MTRGKPHDTGNLKTVTTELILSNSQWERISFSFAS